MVYLVFPDGTFTAFTVDEYVKLPMTTLTDTTAHFTIKGACAAAQLKRALRAWKAGQ
jgi:hypothetical protein